MRELGSQVGQFVVRRHAEEAVHAGESRLRAMLEASLDAVVTMDHRGCVVGWNHAAEMIFGYRIEEAVGKDMADLIVPPALRPRHRRGLARFLETEEAVVLDRRLELTGRRRDGSELPVELTITRIGLPGPPTFTAFLRDITERGLAVALEALALRAPVPIELDTALDGGLPEQVEAAAYYVVAEGLANIHKHAGATRVVVRAAAADSTLVVEVADDGVGGADEEGSGLRGLADRVEALGGSLTLESPQ